MFGMFGGTLDTVQPAEWIGPSIAAITLLGLLGVLVKGAWRVTRRVIHVLDDIQGEPSRPGVPARPGWGEQIHDLRIRQEQIAVVAEQAASDASEVAKLVKHELTRNGGSSTKDKIHETLRKTEANQAMLQQLGADPPPLPHLEDGETAHEQ